MSSHFQRWRNLVITFQSAHTVFKYGSFMFFSISFFFVFSFYVSSYLLFLCFFIFSGSEQRHFPFCWKQQGRIDWTSNSCFFLFLSVFTKKITSLSNKVSTLTASIYALIFPEKAGQKISSTVYAIEVWKSLCGQFSQTRCDRKLRARSKNYHFIARNNCSFFSALFTVWIQTKIFICIFREELCCDKYFFAIYSRPREHQQQM